MRCEVYNIKKQRNEYGRLIRKEYEAGLRKDVRRKDIKELVPMFDGVLRTLTTITEDNLILEVYEDSSCIKEKITLDLQHGDRQE